MKTYICKICKQLSVFRHSKNNIYCSILCQQKDKRNKLVEDWLTGGKKSLWKYSVPSWAKNYIIEVRGYACEECGIDKYNKKEITLQVDHIDGNPSNNNINNLKLLCPNCHSQTDTYAGKNKGTGGRKHRKKY